MDIFRRLVTPVSYTHLALVKAARNGVKVLAFDCDVTPDSITAGDYIDVKF